MADLLCPSCHRKTWSPKWGSCYSCGHKTGAVKAAARGAAPLNKNVSRGTSKANTNEPLLYDWDARQVEHDRVWAELHR